MQPRRQALPILLLVKTAFQLFWQQRDDALRLGLIPTLLVFGGFLYGADALMVFLATAPEAAMSELQAAYAPRAMVLSLLVLVAICLVTVNWLRFLLLGPMGAVGVGLTIGRPHAGFLGATLAIGLAFMAALTACGFVLGLLPPAAALLGNLVAIAAAMVTAMRFVPFLVGKAIGQPLTLAQSWAVSRGNAMPIAISLVLAQLPFLVGLTLLQQILDLIGFSSLAPAGTLFIVSVVQVADWIVQAGVLATAYRHIVGVRV